MKGDAVIRAPRRSWKLAQSYAKKSGRKVREILGAAIEEYVARMDGEVVAGKAAPRAVPSKPVLSLRDIRPV